MPRAACLRQNDGRHTQRAGVLRRLPATMQPRGTSGTEPAACRRIPVDDQLRAEAAAAHARARRQARRGAGPPAGAAEEEAERETDPQAAAQAAGAWPDRPPRPSRTPAPRTQTARFLLRLPAMSPVPSGVRSPFNARSMQYGFDAQNRVGHAVQRVGTRLPNFCRPFLATNWVDIIPVAVRSACTRLQQGMSWLFLSVSTCKGFFFLQLSDIVIVFWGAVLCKA